MRLTSATRRRRAHPPGTMGKIWTTEPGVAGVHWDGPVLTAEYFEDGWFSTGDFRLPRRVVLDALSRSQIGKVPKDELKRLVEAEAVRLP